MTQERADILAWKRRIQWYHDSGHINVAMAEYWFARIRMALEREKRERRCR